MMTQLNTWHERLNVLWRNLASPDVALWTHLIRAPASALTIRAAPRQRLCRRRSRRGIASAWRGETLMVNELYLALLYRPALSVAASLHRPSCWHAPARRTRSWSLTAALRDLREARADAARLAGAL